METVDISGFRPEHADSHFTYKIAVYRSVLYKYLAVKEVLEMEMDSTRFARVSEVIEVKLPKVPHDDRVALEISALEARKAELVDKYSGELQEVEEQLQQLRALPSP